MLNLERKREHKIVVLGFTIIENENLERKNRIEKRRNGEDYWITFF